MKVVDKPVDLLPSRSVAAIGLLVTAVLYAVASYDYLLFHTVAESFAILIAALIYSDLLLQSGPTPTPSPTIPEDG